MTDNLYDKLSKERKKLQNEGSVPMWASTGGYQMFKAKYLYEADSWKDQLKRIASTAAKHTPDYDHWYPKFLEMLWLGWYSCSTPVLANMGTDRGLPVSCSGLYVDDSIAGFYEAANEIAVLSQEGFGTSAFIGDIRPRGSEIRRGGKASGVMPVIKLFQSVCADVSQGNTRRGSGAWYLSAEHGDFWEVIHHLEANPDDLNIGWNIHDSFITALDDGDEEMNDRWQAMLKTKATIGKGYFCFIDKANRQRPEMYKKLGLMIEASQLCTEIFLHSSEDYTYTCVLGSVVVARYDEWKDTDLIFTATVFTDCIASEFIERAKGIKHLEKAVAFTEKSRALGLGQMGLFSLFQKRRIPPDSFDAHMLNIEIQKKLWKESLEASQWLATQFGEPEWCKGFGVRNTHRLTNPPTKSTAGIMGGWSEGINPDPAMVFSSSGSAGDIDRMNPVLLDLIKEKGLNLKKCTQDLLDNNGSAQKVEWLNDEEKSWFKTAFEIDQHVLIRYASQRQRWMDQGQSINLFFAHDDDEEYIASVHQEAFMDEYIWSLYYVYSSSDIKAERSGECEACQ